MTVEETRMDYFTRRSFYKENLLNFLAQQSYLYLLTNIPGNVGDHLILVGTEDLLACGSISYTSIPLRDIEDTHIPQGTLLVPGSGALTNTFHEWLPATIIKASHHFHKVIILPSSYDLSVPIVAECLAQPNVYAFARETGSYRLAKNLGRAALSFDSAVYYHEFNKVPESIPVYRHDTVLSALREDKDSLLYGHGFAHNPAINVDISRAKTNLDEWLETIKCHNTIITDRLHIAVASVLFGKRLIYLDPRNCKISKYFGFTFRDTFNDRVKRCTPEWLYTNEFVIKKATI
jgi:exopolysaccharide biosynthesis predicted pyruvyltransferase EpsI